MEEDSAWGASMAQGSRGSDPVRACNDVEEEFVLAEVVEVLDKGSLS
jgi:hypothetical protein